MVYDAYDWKEKLEMAEENFFKFRNRKKLTVVEIGCRDGGSLLMWRDYFGPQSKVHGIDINPNAIVFQDEQTRIFIGSQDNSTFIASVGKEVGPIDIVIDDASHDPKHQFASYKLLYPYMAHDSVYMIEDLYGKPNLLRSFIPEFEEMQKYHRAIDKSIYSYKLYRNILVIEKKKQSFTNPFVSEKRGTVEIECRFTNC